MTRVIKMTITTTVVLGCLGLISCANSNAESTNKTESSAVAATSYHSKASKPMAQPEVSPDYQKAALANVELGLGYLSQGQVARAKTKLMHALKLAPNISEPHSAMAYFMEMVGDYRYAEKEHKSAVGLSVAKGAVYNNYGAFLCRRGRYKEADQSFNDAVQDKEYARTAEVYENAGLCALKWPDKAASQLKAAEYLTTSILRDPNRSSAMLELAALNLRQGKVNEAKGLLGRYKTVAEPTARSLWLGIQLAKQLQDPNSVAADASQLKNFFEDSPEYQQYLQSEKNS